MTGRPVHVITGEIAEKLGCTDFSSKRVITYQSIGKELGFMAVIKADRMVIHKDTSDETVAAPAIGISELCFSRGKEYQVILHSAMGR